MKLSIDDRALIIASLKQTQELCRKISGANVALRQRADAAAQSEQIDSLVEKLLHDDEVAA